MCMTFTTEVDFLGCPLNVQFGGEVSLKSARVLEVPKHMHGFHDECALLSQRKWTFENPN